MKNNMRKPKEKEKIVKEYLSGKIGIRNLERKYNLNHAVIYRWVNKYTKDGIEGLKSKTGKHKKHNNYLYLKNSKTREEELELKIMKLEIENARLKKGYLVRGGGDQKEYVTTLDENMK